MKFSSGGVQYHIGFHKQQKKFILRKIRAGVMRFLTINSVSARAIYDAKEVNNKVFLCEVLFITDAVYQNPKPHPAECVCLN